MKRVFLIALMCMVSGLTFAQHIGFGVRGAFNSTWLFNKDDSDAGDELDYASTFGGDFGIGAEWMFNEKIGIGVDAILSSNNQKYDLQILGVSAEATHMFTTIDIPILLKIVSPGGAFFELGPNFGLVTKSEMETMGGTVDIIDETASTNIEAMLGFGVDFPISDNLSLSTGLRFGWGLTDVADGNRPKSTNTAAGGLRIALNYILER